MKKAGGILGIIGGVFGVFAALVTLFIGGVGGAFHAGGADTVIGLGWGGLAFSFLSIIFGAVSLGVRSRTVGVLLALSALGGVILGGTMVGICMVLALVGGVLATLGARPAPLRSTLAPSASPARRGGKGRGVLSVMAAVIALGVAGVLAIGMASKPGHDTPGSPSAAAAPGQVRPASTPAALAAPPPQAFQVGQTFSTQNFRLTITSVAVLHRVGDVLTSTAPPGAEYVAVAWRYTNRSSAPVSAFAVPSLHLLDAQGHRYDQDLEASSFYAAQIHASAKALSEVNPGITLTDGAAFEVNTRQFDPSTWTMQVRADGQDVIVRFPAPAVAQGSVQASPSAPTGPASSQAVTSTPATAAASAATPAGLAPAAPLSSASMAAPTPAAAASGS
ncbi:MAG: hypothetical protein AB1412_01940 [Pseudomonadota bacterium]